MPCFNQIRILSTIFVKSPQYEIPRGGGALIHADKSTEQTNLIGAFRDNANAPPDRQTDGREEGNRPFTRDYANAVVSKHPQRRGHGQKKSRSAVYELQSLYIVQNDKMEISRIQNRS